MKTLAERFWSKVKKTESCWTWNGYRTRQGYGRLYDRPTEVMSGLAHRISWRLHHGDIPAGQQVLHRCDNPSCVNPGHLFLGTNADNVKDKLSKGRHGHTRSKLTELIVKNARDLYAAGMDQKLITRIFGIRDLKRISDGRRWASLTSTYDFSLPRPSLLFQHTRV